MKQGWEYKKLKDVTSLFADGDWIESKDQSELGLRLIQTGNIGNGFYIAKDDKPHYISEDTFERLKCTEIFEGDCLISRLPQPLGRACILPKLDFRAITAVDCSIIRFKDFCIPRYFVYYTQSSKYQNTIDKNATGTTRKRISRKNLENISIPVPPLTTQQSIVSELDTLSQIIADYKEQLADYDKLEQSIFYDMFGDPIKNEKGWEYNELKKNVSEMFLGPFGSALKTECYVQENGYAMVYEQKHAIKGTLNLENHYISKEKFDSLARFEVLAGDFIMSCRGTIGKIYQIPIGSPKGIIHPSVMKIRIKDSYNHLFFNYMLEKIIAASNTNGNCVQMAITAKELGNKELIIPPLPLQQQFASKIESIEQIKADTKAALQDAELLFQSRMDYWFNA